MKIVQRLYAQVALVTLGVVLLTANSTHQMHQVYESANFANDNTVPSLLDLETAYDSFSHLRVATWQLISAAEPADKARIRAKANELMQRIGGAFDQYEKADIDNDRDRSLLKTDRDAFAVYKSDLEVVFRLADEGRDAEARSELFSRQKSIQAFDAAFAEHRAYNKQQGLNNALDAKRRLELSLWGTAGFACIIIVALSVFGFLLARRIREAMSQAVDIASRVADGDLAVPIPAQSDDEIGDVLKALKGMTEKLSTLVVSIRSAASTIHSASSEIASGNMNLSSRTEQQAGSLEETASSMEQLTSAVAANADGANQASLRASQAAEKATAGGEMVRQVIERMTLISASAEKIADIISVIDGIAFQTNILALNAAVEAARAGEQGRGFAVVATEVRNLAQRSAAAAKEIKALINTSSEHVGTGNMLVNKTGEMMSEVVNYIAGVSTTVSEISAATREQSHGITQVNQAIVDIDGSTQQNAALVEQAAAAASALSEQAEALADLISSFKLRHDAAASQAAQPHRSVAVSSPIRLAA